MRRLFVLVSVFALIVLGAGPVSSRAAAQADPMASPTTVDEGSQLRGIPPEACQVAPRPSEEVYALLGLAEGTEGAATPVVVRTPVPAPPWQAASEDTVQAATATIREWLACINADDNFRIAALMTDEALVRFFGGRLVADEAIEGARANLAGTPVPRTEEQNVRLVAVSDVSLLDDGRVAALALIDEPVLPPEGQETLLVILVQVDNHLLIDDVVQFSVGSTGAATPRAGGATTGSVTARVFVCPAESDQALGWDATEAEFQAYETDLLAACAPDDDPGVAPALVTLPDEEPTTPGTHIAPGVYRWTDVPFGDYVLGGAIAGMPSSLAGVFVTRAGAGPVQQPVLRLDTETPDVEYHYFYFLTSATPEGNSTS